MRIHNGDVTLDASGHGEAALSGLHTAASATASLIAVEHVNGPQGIGAVSRPARGDTSIVGIVKPDGSQDARLVIDNGEPGAVVRALVWQE